MSWRLEPQSDLVVELHLMPGDEPEPVQVSVGLFFTDRRPARTGYMLRLGRQDIDIAAGRRDYVNADATRFRSTSTRLPCSRTRIFSRKDVRAWATLPGRRDCPAHSHQGLELSLAGRLYVRTARRAAEGHRHRDALHVRQFNGESRESASASQARHVRSDQRVRNGIAVAAGRASPSRQISARLERDFGPKILRDDIAGNEKWLEVEPRNAQLRAELAACYLEANRPIRCADATPGSGAAGSDGRPALRRRTCAADSAGLLRRGGRRSEARSTLQASVCRGDLRSRRRPARATQPGRSDRVVREGAGRGPARTYRATTISAARSPSEGRSIAPFRAITRRSSCRRKMPTRIRAWRARS